MAIQIESRVVRSEELLSASLGEEVAIADINAEKYYAFNSVATEVWARIGTATAVKDLCADLCAEYDVPASRCEADVLAFLEKLHQKGMIRVLS